MSQFRHFPTRNKKKKHTKIKDLWEINSEKIKILSLHVTIFSQNSEVLSRILYLVILTFSHFEFSLYLEIIFFFFYQNCEKVQNVSDSELPQKKKDISSTILFIYLNLWWRQASIGHGQGLLDTEF